MNHETAFVSKKVVEKLENFFKKVESRVFYQEKQIIAIGHFKRLGRCWVNLHHELLWELFCGR